jgi:hypothetical protein
MWACRLSLLQRTFVTYLGLDPIREALILISIVEIQIPKNRDLTSWLSHNSPGVAE